MVLCALFDFQHVAGTPINNHTHIIATSVRSAHDDCVSASRDIINFTHALPAGDPRSLPFADFIATHRSVVPIPIRVDLNTVGTNLDALRVCGSC